MEKWELNGHTLVFYDDTHTYFVDNEMVPSVTQILHETKFKDKYKGINNITLQRAAYRGTIMHEAIERYEKERIDTKTYIDTDGIEVPLLELYSYKTIKRLYGFEVEYSEIPIIVELDGKVVCAGKLDQIINLPDKDKILKCVNDFKRTATLDLEYLAYQETIYAIGFEQCYGEKVDDLRATHLRETTKSFKKVKRIDEEVIRLLKEYTKENEVENIF